MRFCCSVDKKNFGISNLQRAKLSQVLPKKISIGIFAKSSLSFQLS